MERNIKRKVFHLCKEPGCDVEFQSMDDWWFFRLSFHIDDKISLYPAGGMDQKINGIAGDIRFNEAVVV